MTSPRATPRRICRVSGEKMRIPSLLALLLLDLDPTSSYLFPSIGGIACSDPIGASDFLLCRASLPCGKPSRRSNLSPMYQFMSNDRIPDSSSHHPVVCNRRNVLELSKNAILSLMFGCPLMSSAQEGGPNSVGRSDTLAVTDATVTCFKS